MNLRFTHVVTFVLVAAPFGVLSADAQPGGGTVVSGSAAISNPSATSTIVNQTTGSAIINWQNFSLASGSSVQFNQPSAAAITLNRVLGGGASEIYGSLQANGQIWIINSNGILFGHGAQINVSGLLATTSDIADSDFAAGRYNFNTPSTNMSASVDNAGTIHVANGGSAILSGSHVANQGLIQADAGNIVLGGANAFTVDFDGDNLLRYQITAPISNSPTAASGAALPETVANSGTLAASGGSILMTSRAAANVADNVINNTGIILARSAAVRNGQVILDAGDGTVQAGGTIDASGRGAGQTGGSVALAGSTVRVADGAHIDVSGDQGGGTVNIGGDLHGTGPMQNAENTSVGSATIDANAISAGNGGTLVVWSNGLTDFSGIFSATGGLMGGNGGFAETSGHTLNIAPTARVDTLAPNGAVGTWLMDPTTITIETAGSDPITGSNISPLTVTNALISSDVILEASSGTPSLASITVKDDVTYSSSHTLSLLSQGDIYVAANIQNSGTGGIFVIAGWDGHTTDKAHLTDPGVFGAAGSTGVVYVTSDYDNDFGTVDSVEATEGEVRDVAVGSAGGSTTVAGKFVELPAVYGASQIGYLGRAGGGSIIVDATTGVSFSGTFAAQIGNNSGQGNVSIATNNFSALNTPTIKGQTVTLQPYSSSTTMGLGAGAGSLGLTQAVLNGISATTLVFGNTADSGAITVGGNVSVPATVTNLHLVTGGDITIGARSTITDANANAQLVLAAGGAFTNDDGSGALVAGGTNGRWLVYSSSPTVGGENFGSLNSNNTAVWNATYATLPPASVSQTGNRYLFAYQPTLTVTTTNVVKTYGSDVSASVAAAYILSGVQAGVANAFLGDTVSGTPAVTSTGSAATASVSPGSPYAITATTGSLAVPNGYATEFHNTGTLTVNPAALTITASPQSTTYGMVLNLGTSAFTSSGLRNGESIGGVTLLSNGSASVPSNLAAGTYSSGVHVITPSAATGGTFNASNYSISYNTGTLTVNPAALLITANNDSKTYGTVKNFSGTAFTASGLVAANGDTITSVTESSTGAPVSASIGGYAIVASNAVGTGLSNYTISYNTGTLTVNPAALLITANDRNKTYGTNLALGTTGFTTSTLYNSDTVTGVTLTSAGSAASATVSGGPYAITPSAATGTGLSNYSITYATGLLTVTPAVLSYVADLIGVPFGSAIPTLTGAVTGFVNGDTQASATTGTPVFSTSATSSSAPGSYAVNGSGLTALNGDYTFTQSPSNATALTISAASAPPPPPDISGVTSAQSGLQGDRPTDLDSVTSLLDHSDSTSIESFFVTQHEGPSLTVSVDSTVQSGPIATLTVDGNGYIEPPTSADQLSNSLSQYYGDGSSFDDSYPGWGNQALWY